ncbi:nucleotide-diphospho-sugar transferase [Lindgomyces ingoldianus]|uniref:Nucleotide-diphospho-sugar transferase n=1 Tax=Lindgomyces ingoldianus TaxID=673940 RepID=A0ACB6QDE2_9PLEO|nr:nucleotide-diphospho-sugar transferase [Lindgomyces ingoldianus]KAF2465004.1 nucleotide-diphospho-sugar transferase [Lindgomyces ingoldianus]
MAILRDFRGLRIVTAAAIAILIALLVLLNHRLPEGFHPLASLPGSLSTQPTHQTITQHTNSTGKLAYVTWLSSTLVGPDSEDLDNDNYFIATRILVWQLLHAPKTRSHGIDVVVVITPSVSESRRKRLEKDGAIVRRVEFVHGKNEGWINPEQERWKDIMTKLRVWEMVDYERMLMLDGDTILNKPLDDAFNDPGAQIVSTLPVGHAESRRKGDEPDLPSQYLLASVGETKNYNHTWPPTKPTDFERPDYFCAGFFLLSPSLELFKYYTALLDIKNRFDTRYMEQSLLNYAHRPDGPMPWKEVDYKWNVRHVNERDVEKGLVSMHEKWWLLPWSGSTKLRDEFLKIRWEMEGWYMERNR